MENEKMIINGCEVNMESKQIEISQECKKDKKCTTEIKIDNDKIIICNNETKNEVDLKQISTIIRKNADLNCKLAFVYLATSEEVINHKQIGLIDFTSNPGRYIVLCSGIFKQAPANAEAEKIEQELSKIVTDYQEKNGIVLPTKKEGCIYSVDGARGRCLEVYEDKCVLIVKKTMGSFLTGNYTDGEKTIYYSDIIGVQFKESDLTLGYLQLETASSQMNNGNSNYFGENSFTYDGAQLSNDKVREISNFIKSKVESLKTKSSYSKESYSVADEIKKYKELLDAGVLTQEEFDAKKKQLLK